MIIVGTKGRIKEVGSGQFMCPRCRAIRSYKRKHAARYFTLYFIPLFKIKDLGEFIECQTCGGTFQTAVLQPMTTANSEPKIPGRHTAAAVTDDSSEAPPRA